MIAFIHRHIALWQRRQSLGWLLHRADDHLLDDIGLCRDDVRIMLDSTEDFVPLPPITTLHRVFATITA